MQRLSDEWTKLRQTSAAIWPNSIAPTGRNQPLQNRNEYALKKKIAALTLQMVSLKEIEAKLIETGETQISLTDPDARSMMTRGSGIVGYNVQTAVDAKHHLIVEHEVTNTGSDRDQLSGIAKKARTAIGTKELTALADRGYFNGKEILACHEAGIATLVPPTKTSNAKADGRFDKADFIYEPEKNEYR